jgi:uroporphyrinogen decarboxylase
VFQRIRSLYDVMYEGMARHPQVGAVVISDDLGYKAQTLVGPEDLRELVLPVHGRLAAIIHAHGKPCILHSCGNLEAIMEDVIGAVGIDAKHSYEDTILPVVEAKRRYGDRIAILGGFDVDRLSRSTPAQVRDYVDLLLREAGHDGGYALGSGNSIPEFVPVENYLTMLDQGWRRRTA